ncbi:MAG TPA: sortase [Steroidobacteraceae bacterium]|nr:sortase [Steroidobacteraceae bacterium]
MKTLEILFWIAGLALLLVYSVAQTDARLGRDQAIDTFRVAQAALAAESVAVTGVPVPDQSLWSPARKAAYAGSLAASLDAPSAILRIPRLDLTVPVFEGTSELALNRGVGRIAGTAAIDEPGNLGIAGHRDGYFRPLKDIAVGDRIELETLTGRLTFRVDDTLIVSPETVDVLAPTEESVVTLVTCYPFYFVGNAPQRFIVRAVSDGAGVSSRK